MDLRILITIMLFFIIIILVLPSKFNNIHPDYTNDKYECGENKRLYPEGHISGDYLGLNKYNMDDKSTPIESLNRNDDSEVVNQILNKYNNLGNTETTIPPPNPNITQMENNFENRNLNQEMFDHSSNNVAYKQHYENELKRTSKLNMNQELTMLCKFISNKVETQNIILDNTPHSIALGIIYFISQICNQNISKTEIKNICGVSEVTINKCYKKLDNIKESLIPSCIINKYN